MEIRSTKELDHRGTEKVRNATRTFPEPEQYKRLTPMVKLLGKKEAIEIPSL